jgi:hypothetical protein
VHVCVRVGVVQGELGILDVGSLWVFYCVVFCSPGWVSCGVCGWVVVGGAVCSRVLLGSSYYCVLLLLLPPREVSPVLGVHHQDCVSKEGLSLCPVFAPGAFCPRG